jgi:hypothetical protein
MHRMTKTPWLAELAAFLGGLSYLIQSWVYAHTQISLMDEGDYLYKGYLFVTGRYWPYQDSGPWTNHMPLAFLIPGSIQKWFGVGLRTGRYTAVGLGVLTLLGLWIVTRRLGGRWWAALAIWAVALNPMLIKMYSIAGSQVLIACMLMWMLALTLDEGRSLWQLILGSMIAGILLLTRLNMAPVLPILLAYIWWQRGHRAFIPAVFAGLITVAIGHIIFWPNILKLWAAWLPASITPFFDPWREMSGGELFWKPIFTDDTRFESFYSGMRLHFFAILGVLSAWLLWPPRGNWENKAQYKTGVFLSVLFGTLFLLHAWASIGMDNCVYCFRRYLAFFSLIGIVLFVSTFKFGLKKLSRARQSVILLTLMIFSVPFTFFFVDNLLSVQVPRIRSMQIMPGTTELWKLFANKFGLSWEIMFVTLFVAVSLTAVPMFFGLVYLGKRFGDRIDLKWDRSFASLVLIALLAFGLLLSPTEALSGSYHNYDCGGDVIESYEQVGEHLAATIPARASVFWKGGRSFVPLLYIPEAEVFPAQLNGDYTFRLGGDTDSLSKYGLWNQDLALRWWQESDYLLFEEQLYNEWITASDELKSGEKFYTDLLRSMIPSGEFVQLEPSTATLPCQSGSRIFIFERQP